ncbi:MAG: hypothetical protein HQ580_15050 [Planctomycetes bacterium]|nr:hypothetical protein [Planctomycetota bacterium]
MGKLRLEGLGPPTFGSVDRCSKTVKTDKVKTCESSKEPLTPQWTPEFREQGETDTQELPTALVEIPEHMLDKVLTIVESAVASQLSTDLIDIVEAWPGLPDSIKSAILALVKASEHVE